MKQLTSRQVSVLTFLSIISIKLIVLPSLICKVSGNNAYLAFIFNLVADFLSLFAYFWFMKKYPNLTFKEALIQVFGKVVCKIIFALLFFYFFIKAIIIFKEIQNYFNRVLFDDFGWINYIIPSVILLAFMVSKPIKTFGRSAEGLYYFVLASAFLVLVTSSYEIDFACILPFMQNGIKPVMQGAVKSTFAFGDYLFLLLYLGNIKYSKNGKKTIIIYSLLSIALMSAIFIVFIGTFGKSAINENLALSDISLNLAIPLTVGRIDWINILIWSFLLFFQCALVLKSSVICFEEFTSIHNKIITMCSIFIIYLIMVSIEKLSLSIVLQFVTSTPFVMFASFIQMGYPGILVLCGIILKKRNFKSTKTKFALTKPLPKLVPIQPTNNKQLKGN